MIIPATVACNYCNVRWDDNPPYPWVVALLDEATGHHITAKIGTLWELLQHPDHWCSHNCMEISLAAAQRESEKREPCQIPQRQL